MIIFYDYEENKIFIDSLFKAKNYKEYDYKDILNNDVEISVKTTFFK